MTTYFHEKCDEVANSLRRMADQIEREVETCSDPSIVIERIIHTVTWGVANLGLDRLVAIVERERKVEQHD